MRSILNWLAVAIITLAWYWLRGRRGDRWPRRDEDPGCNYGQGRRGR